MHYFMPELALGVLLPEETELVEKFGGLPWGLPQEKWPLCKSCGKPLSHLFTLKHDTDRLDLGKVGRVLMAFMCNHAPGSCETWEMDSGANAVLILDEGQFGSGVTDAPGDGAQMETEAFIVSWRQGEDVVPEAEAATYSNVQLNGDLLGESWNTLYNSTKLGSLPAWVQFPEGPPVPPFRFIGQFDDSLVFHGPPPPSAARAFCDVWRWHEVTRERETEKPPEGWVPVPGGPTSIHVSDNGTYRCEGPNYGGGGMAYLFLTAAQPNTLPQGKFLWQCT